MFSSKLMVTHITEFINSQTHNLTYEKCIILTTTTFKYQLGDNDRSILSSLYKCDLVQNPLDQSNCSAHLSLFTYQSTLSRLHKFTCEKHIIFTTTTFKHYHDIVSFILSLYKYYISTIQVWLHPKSLLSVKLYCSFVTTCFFRVFFVDYTSSDVKTILFFKLKFSNTILTQQDLYYLI